MSDTRTARLHTVNAATALDNARHALTDAANAAWEAHKAWKAASDAATDYPTEKLADEHAQALYAQWGELRHALDVLPRPA